MNTLIRVAYADTDAMGIVHHSNYLRYFEVARVNWLRERGVSYREWEKQGFHLPLVESQCRYRRAARFDDVLEVKLHLNIKGVRLTMEYEVVDQKSGELVATGMTQHVCVDRQMKVMPLPEELKQLV